MSDETGRGKRTGLVKRIWLHIGSEGGWWTISEVADALGTSREAVNRTMHGMTTRQGLLCKSKRGRLAAFGVTPECKIPNGLTLKDIASAKLT